MISRQYDISANGLQTASRGGWRWCVWPFVLLLSVSATKVAADTIVVPDDFITIQEAIDAAVDGDEILVRPGSYGRFEFLGKRIVVRSTDGVEQTSVEFVEAFRDESPETKLIGFSVAFLTIRGSSPALKDVALNTVEVSGSPIFQNCTSGGVQAPFAPFDIDGGSPSFHNCTFADNLTDVCPALLIRSGSVLVVNSVFEDNASDEFGGTGAVCVGASSTFIAISSKFIDNGRVFDDGGAIHNDGMVYAYASEFNDNSGGRGGAIFNSSGATAHFYQSTFDGNHGDTGPGLVPADHRHGGAIYNEQGGLVTLDRSRIINSETTANGGGVYNLGQLVLTDSSMRNNSADLDGGAIYNGASALTVLTKSLLRRNSAGGDGGGIFNDGKLAQVTGVRLRANTPDDCFETVNGTGCSLP